MSTAECQARLSTLQKPFHFREKTTYLVQFQLDIERSKLYILPFTGQPSISNHDFVERFNELVLELFAPSIEARDPNNTLFSLAHLCIAYLIFLFWVRIVDRSEPPYDQHNFIALFAEMVLKGLDILVAKVMHLVRDGQHQTDAESRPGICVLYFHLLDLDRILHRLEECTIFVSHFIYSLISYR